MRIARPEFDGEAEVVAEVGGGAFGGDVFGIVEVGGFDEEERAGLAGVCEVEVSGIRCRVSGLAQAELHGPQFAFEGVEDEAESGCRVSGLGCHVSAIE